MRYRFTTTNLGWIRNIGLQVFRERLSEKGFQVHATRPKDGLDIKDNFAYWPRGNEQVCIFALQEFVFPFRRLVSVALL